MRRFLTGLALVAGALAAATSASAAIPHTPGAPPKGLGIRLLDAPADAGGDPRARAYIVDHVAPGTVLDRRVEITNGGEEDAVFSVYAAAAHVADGTFSGDPGDTQNELSQWISFAPRAPAFGPGERTVVTVTVSVPDDATQGERYGVIWAQSSVTPEAGGITQVTRVGIRVYLSVGVGEAPPTDFDLTKVTASRTSEGVPVVHATVHNTGDRALDLSVELTLSEGPGGSFAGPFAADAPTTLGIGQSATLDIELDPELPDGPWRASVTATNGQEVRSIEATVTFPRAGQTVEATVTSPEAGQTVEAAMAPGSSRSMVIAAVAALLVVVSAVAVWRARARRRRVRSGPPLAVPRRSRHRR